MDLEFNVFTQRRVLDQHGITKEKFIEDVDTLFDSQNQDQDVIVSLPYLLMVKEKLMNSLKYPESEIFRMIYNQNFMGHCFSDMPLKEFHEEIDKAIEKYFFLLPKAGEESEDEQKVSFKEINEKLDSILEAIADLQDEVFLIAKHFNPNMNE
ncbi:hypothetical protein TVAG_111160 [Trichomonas vaginalis G3]|uniref:Uncharacterized protein n=1 Tax=Trichomonas vaginalis (strain ATCC PRA-98 / G3) TaxID=412133 RepID=A2EZX5_TRIV3|nr:hypothetical protein TVAGG3_0145090 [Trichomonas vaginalis G3]EAY01759.1 hypothetical protein TVAG_111160 [Trichomonas vaginalis G3]KAI5546862.1 hypothetical protein TVAGG3_0145090 [Trichomonas vaginalis G3]|eukprot:XP_001314317.1 hypothetical protein [Trichomonas vaginalis G3]